MPAAMLVLVLAAAPPEADKEVTAAEKKAFLELLVTLPRDGEFYTDAAVQKATGQTRVLLALTVKDLDKLGIYPLLALSRGLLNLRDQREFGVKHFSQIAHPVIKLSWGAMIFNEKAASPEIVAFLRAALESKEQSRLLAEMVGPNFDDFKKRVMEYQETR